MDATLKIVRTAVRSLGQHKLRSFLSALGIVCGVMAVLSMISVGEGAKQEVVQQIEQLGTRNIYVKAIRMTTDQHQRAQERLSSGLSLQDVNRIVAGVKDVHQVAALKEVRGTVSDVGTAMAPSIVAVSANYGAVQNLIPSAGRFITPLDVVEKNMVCVLGNDVADQMGVKGKPGQYIRIENHLYRIVGTLNRFHRLTAKTKTIAIRNYNQMIFIPLGTESSLSRSTNQGQTRLEPNLSEVVIQVARRKQVLNAAKTIDRVIQVSHNQVKDYQMIVPRELLQQAQATQRTFNIVLGAIAGVSLLVGGIGIMNIMLATVTERIREIGIRRAVGASQTDIVVQFLVEAIILTFSGGLIGVVVGLGAVTVITHLSGWHTSITTWSIIVPLAMSILVGIFFGLYPAVQAARMDPVAALRHD